MNCKNILVINQDSRDIRYDCEGSFPDQPMDIASKSEKKNAFADGNQSMGREGKGFEI